MPLSSVKQLLLNNKQWLESRIKINPNYFKDMEKGQDPHYLWIGCSDSRVPANEITGTEPGEMFVHRNVANLVVFNDINLMSVVNYSVDVLKINHIIVCGHTHCGGVKAAMQGNDLGMMNQWLANIRQVANLHEKELATISDESQRYLRLIELNTIEQVKNLARLSIVQTHWRSRQAPFIHGWIYDIGSGAINPLIDIGPQNYQVEDAFALKNLR
jgi:carbonic anhydrase